MNFKKLSAAFLAIGVAGCSTFGGGSSAPTATAVATVAAPAVKTTPVVFTQPTAKVAIAPVTIKLPERRGLGTYTRNVDCWVYVRPIRDTDFPPGAPLTVELRKALVGSKVDVVAGEKADVAAAQGADYLITANVPLAHADLCINDFFNADPADVDAAVTVSWEVWSVRENRVVFQTTTTGTGSAKSKEQVITPAVLLAMGDAAEQLLQSAVMQQYLTFGHPNLPQVNLPAPVGQTYVAPAQPAAPAGIALPGLVTAPGGAPAPAAVAPSALPILVTLPAPGASDLKAGTIMIGKSAGFYVGDEGYAITSAAAVGGAATVTVTDGSGKSLQAVVVRRADAAGLALLKVTGAAPAALPILAHRLSAGDKVTTVGAGGPVSGTAGAKLAGASAGAAVVDAAGNIVGVVESSGSTLPIAAAFKALTLGVTLTER